jgi:GH25 family lysozyme M1 (1,4-beta-N-acetylmuramidase)
VSRSPAAPAILSRSFAVPAALLVAFLVLVAAAPNADAAKGGAKGPPARSPTPTTTITRLEGIDVSQWQGAINWSQVKSSGKQFALIRASAGSLTVDEWYASNRSSAKANGLKIGAYHYANPDSAANDALNEANFFLSLATPARGELIPTLDVEVTNGLSVAAMQAWVSTWLQRVTSVLGVRPMIYTSPSFWTTYLGDTTQFADAGYRLWIAHWGVDQPRIPASNWGGRGWTFWQYTSSGTVPGISGNVDLDRYNGSQLASSLFIP